MGNGFLIVHVYTDNVSLPVAGAIVLILSGDRELRFITDASGKTDKIMLPAPDKKYSLEPQGTVKPYADYTIRVFKDEYNPSVITGVEIFDGETSIQDVFLSDKVGDESKIDVVELPEHDLWETEKE